MTQAAQTVDPEVLKHLVEIGYIGLYAFGIFMVAIAVVFATLFSKGNLSGESVARIIQETNAPRFATIVLIVASVSVLTVLRLVDGAAAITLLSGVAGYVLGNAPAPKRKGSVSPSKEPSAPQ